MSVMQTKELSKTLTETIILVKKSIDILSGVARRRKVGGGGGAQTFFLEKSEKQKKKKKKGTAA